MMGAAGAGAGVVYEQSVADEPIGYGFFSHSAPRDSHSFKHADNFTLGSDASIRRVSWFGIGEGEQTSGLENVASFTIELWSSRLRGNGLPRPDALITSETFSLAQTGPTPTGRTDTIGAMEFEHAATLTSAWDLSGGTTYWISISAESIDPSGDAWKWRDSVDVDRISNSLDYGTDRWINIIDTDSAFSLSTVPAPSSLALLALVGVGSRRRR
jgi:hypothetical protein